MTISVVYFFSVLGVGVLAMLIVAIFLDNIDREQASQFRGNPEPFCHTFLATFRLLKDWRLLTLIPLTMYSGFEQSFLSGEYTKVRRLLVEFYPSKHVGLCLIFKNSPLYNK